MNVQMNIPMNLPMNMPMNAQAMPLVQMGPMRGEVQMVDHSSLHPHTTLAPDPPSNQAPLPVLFERVAHGLRNGDYGIVFASIAQLNVLGRTELNFVSSTLAPYGTIVARLYDLLRSSQGKQGPMPSIDCLERTGLTDILFDHLYCLSVPLQKTLVSPLYDHSVKIEEAIQQVDVLVAQSRPSRDFIDNLPEEILIRIGHILLERPDSAPSVEVAPAQVDGLPKLPLTPTEMQRRRDNDRLSLSTISRRWRAIFGLGELWDEVDVASDVLAAINLPVELQRARGRKAQQKLLAFLARGGVKTIDLRDLYTSEELLPALDAMEGRSAGVRSWSVGLSNGVSFKRVLDVWKAKDDFHLHNLSIMAGNVSLPSWPINLSSLSTLQIDHAAVDLVSLLPRVPNLATLKLTACFVDRSKASVGRPVVIRLANLSLLLSHGRTGAFYQAGSVLFDLPNLANLTVFGDPEQVAAFLPPAPQPSHSHLSLLYLPETIRGDFGLVPILDRHPSLTELCLYSGGSTAAALEALGRGTCPNLRVLRILVSFDDHTLGPALGQAVLTMIRAREAAANRGDELAALCEFHLDGGWFDSMMFSREEKEWLWAHLRLLGGFGSRPKHIPAPA